VNIVATRNLGKLKEKLELQLTIACSNADNISDLGANVGSVTKSIPKIGKPVFAYEPDPVPFEELNKIIDSNLKTHLAAAWTSDGCIELFHHHDWEN
jgi:FkbM family methyltransferase